MTYRVSVNIYNMHWSNEYLRNIGIGVYHSGVVLHGVEIAFGGHPFAFSGIFEIEPRDTTELGENFQFKESLDLGCTEFSRAEIETMLEQLGTRYRGDTYHLLKNNCNHFTNEFVQLITGQQLPKWVNRLATIGDTIPFIERALPKEWLTPIALEENISAHQNGES